MPRKITQSNAVVRALDVLVSLRQHEDASIRDLAAHTGLSRTTVHRSLLALQSRLFVMQDETTGRYRLGPRLIDLGHSASRRLNLRDVALSELQHLARLVGETAIICERTDNEMVCQEYVESGSALHVSLSLGARLPIHRSAFGKVLLAYIPVDEVRSQLASCIGPRELENLQAEFSTIRQNGIASDRDVAGTDTLTVAAQILDYTGRALASLGICAPTLRVDGTHLTLEQLGLLVRSSAQRLSVRLGYTEFAEMWQELANANQDEPPAPLPEEIE